MFKWRNEYLTNVSSIDEQHRTLFSIAEKLKNIVLGEPNHTYPETLEEIFEALIEYTIYHFSTEEEYMIKINVPHFTDHEQAHRQFIQSLNKLNFTTDHDTAKELLTNLHEWLRAHVMEEVKIFKNVKEKMA